ncbi:DUF3293 domain-containing protein [Candidatus Accumulibacter sp. ACC003]|uniref:DUF3293 domain-containing protein n=1 Tax=Candidatus Accumulibacter sp. ACC003 TaxID=2823334 RepID=UPI0025C08949|nr:DUF3293 domain-containing protein [Candidatus Accumulibacter sp. ACC003]
MRIGVADSGFDDFLGRLTTSPERLAALAGGPVDGLVGWGIVTAYNPGSLLSEDQNSLRHLRLYDRLSASRWLFLAGCNVADDNLWPAEPNYLVLDVQPPDIVALGREFGQVAVVWGRRGTAPKLLWI